MVAVVRRRRRLRETTTLALSAAVERRRKIQDVVRREIKITGDRLRQRRIKSRKVCGSVDNRQTTKKKKFKVGTKLIELMRLPYGFLNIISVFPFLFEDDFSLVDSKTNVSKTILSPLINTKTVCAIFNITTALQ